MSTVSIKMEGEKEFSPKKKKKTYIFKVIAAKGSDFLSWIWAKSTASILENIYHSRCH